MDVKEGLFFNNFELSHPFFLFNSCLLMVRGKVCEGELVKKEISTSKVEE